MQYKNATKIIIDKRKLDILIRLGCPDNQILELIKIGKFTPTGDSLIDETLECLVDFKEFKNWGGNHNPKGINGCNKKKKRGQVDQQVDKQDDCQVVDKDIDKDIEEDKDKKNKYIFEGKIIKLNAKDFNDWQLAYPDLNLRAECLQRDKWLQGQPLEEQKKWFITTSAYFIKQNEKRKRQNAELNEKYETEEECWF